MIERNDWHLRDAHDLASEHGVNPALGLPEAEAGERIQRHGIQSQRGKSQNEICQVQGMEQLLRVQAISVLRRQSDGSARHADRNDARGLRACSYHFQQMWMAGEYIFPIERIQLFVVAYRTEQFWSM